MRRKTFLDLAERIFETVNSGQSNSSACAHKQGRFVFWLALGYNTLSDQVSFRFQALSIEKDSAERHFYEIRTEWTTNFFIDPVSVEIRRRKFRSMLDQVWEESSQLSSISRF